MREIEKKVVKVLKKQGIFSEKMDNDEDIYIDSFTFIQVMISLEREFDVDISDKMISGLTNNGASISVIRCVMLIKEQVEIKRKKGNG